MAYMNQEKKKKIAAELKKVVPADWKYSLRVQNHSTIIMTISAAPVDLIAETNSMVEDGKREWMAKDNFSVNNYHPQNYFNESLPIIEKIIDALNTDNFDNSDPMTDYFHVGHYVDLQVGRWDKPFIVTKKKAA
jgi:hypothetical protein